MRHSKRFLRPMLGVGLCLTATACGFEGLLVDLLTKEPQLEIIPPGTGVFTLSGLGGSGTLYLYDLNGNELLTAPVSEGANEVEVPGEAAVGTVRAVVVGGNKVLKALVTCLTPATLEAGFSVDLTPESTAAMLVVEALGSFRGFGDLTGGEGSALTALAMNPYALSSYAELELETVYSAVLTSPSEAALAFTEDVKRVLNAGSASGSGAPMFVPVVSSSSLLDDAFLAATSVDVDGDGSADASGAAFNLAGQNAAAELRSSLLQLPGVPFSYTVTDESGASQQLETQLIRTIFTVHTEGDMKDANNNTLSLCSGKSIVCDEGKSMFFTGGVHKESPVQDSTINELLGAFIPNTLPMYDDGVHGGDEVAADGIYTISFLLPVGLRLGYKYTWGLAGEGWTGTEEWPGNQRLLEISDLNGDQYVWRDDNIGDETTNKDKSNCYGGGCSQVVTWTTDINGDGWLEAFEHPLAADISDASAGLVTLTGDNVFSEWVQPTRTARALPGACE